MTPVRQEVFHIGGRLWVTVLPHAIVFYHVFNYFPLYTSVAAQKEADHQIYLPGVVVDHGYLCCSELLRVGDIGHLDSD